MTILQPLKQRKLNLSHRSDENPAVGSSEMAIASYLTETPAGKDRLMEIICERQNLRRALSRVRANKGAPGIDGMSVDQLTSYLRRHWPKIRADLLAGTYQPLPVRRKEIPKPSGGVRLLGIPTALDRLVQQAVGQVLQQIWNPSFSESSFGFRPGRNQHQAIKRAQNYVAEGYRNVVDMDLSKFFDRVSLSRLATKVHDKRVLKLVRRFLTAGVMVGGLQEPSVEGTPQGGPLSPLLSNIVLDELDKELVPASARTFPAAVCGKFQVNRIRHLP
jgi:RNA-directed DNA polymerase